MNSFLKFLSRNKLYTAIEAVGLIVSIAFVVLIGNYVWQQYALACENPLGDRIYTVLTDDNTGMSWWDKASFEEQLPEVESACRLSSVTTEVFRIGDTSVQANSRYVDREFFDVFPRVGMVEGSAREFAVKGNCLISESFATRNFEGSPLGTQITFVDFYTGNDLTMTVCGVYDDTDGTLLGPCDVMLNAAYDYYANSNYRPFSTRGQYITLLKVPADADRDALTQKITNVCDVNYKQWQGETIYTVARFDELCFLSGQYFVRPGNRAMLVMLAVVVVLLLVSAIFNYVNLNTALSGRRAKEMAMRRLLGSQRAAIFGTYIAESVAFALLCTVLALLVAEAFRPGVDSLLRNVAVGDVDDAWQYMPLRIDWSAGALAVYAVGAVLTGAIVGMAPAVLAMRYAPIDIVRGTFRRRTKMLFSRVFIVFQNAVSVALIALSLVMELQMHHMLARPLHACTDGRYTLRFLIRAYDDVRPLVDRLHKIPEIGRIGIGHGYPSSMSMSTYITPTDDPERAAEASIILCDESYFELLGLETVADYHTPRTNSVWVGESFANELALVDSLQILAPRNLAINGARPEVYGGIYRDIPTTDASRQSELPAHSIVIIGQRDKILYTNGLLIEVTGDRRAAAEAIHAAYAGYYTERYGMYNDPWDEGYLDDVIAAQLQPLKMAMRLVELFMALSVLISLLGLVAMSTYFAGENTRSIAIRKVFGSDTRRELRRTVGGYLAMVAVAVAIGIPAAVWLAERYLEQFAYRIEGYGWIFVAAAGGSVAIACGSVFWQTRRAARTNPATELKKE